MRLSNSKKQLAKIISENGGWRDGSNFYAQDGCGEVWSYIAKPSYHTDIYGFTGDEIDIEFRYETVKNFHQTIISRDEYFHLYPAPDADGWIEWKGGECPVDAESVVCYKMRDGCVFKRGEPAAGVRWAHIDRGTDIIAYRLHKAETPTSTVIEPKPTFEQLAAEYSNRKDYAERKQQEADAAKAEAEAALEKLHQAGLEIGLNIAINDPDPDLVITDWRDLQVGDEVECLQITITGDDYADDRIGSIGLVVATEEPGKSGQAVKVRFDDGDYYWIVKWRFIRRP